jgi:hypothetical protein
MDIWNVYISERKHKKKMENKNKNDNILKKYDKSYDEIRTHVLETPETKENHLSQVIGNLPRKKININV